MLSQSAQALHKLLTGCATSKSYPPLQVLRLKLLKTQDSAVTSPTAALAGAAAAACAADWTCLVWLLQTAPEDVVAGLKAEWQKQQVQEYATWVRPAVELSTVRSKAAAKVCCAVPCCAICCDSCAILRRAVTHSAACCAAYGVVLVAVLSMMSLRTLSFIH